MRRFAPWSLALALASALALPPRAAGAGEIRGVVTVKTPVPHARTDAKAPPSRDVVVWVTGLKGTGVPTERPVLAQKGMEFSPSLLVVVAGQTVAMPNDDDLAHNVISESPAKRFNLGIYPKGDTKFVTFDQAGRVDVRCSLHRRMAAEILVVPNAYYSLGAAGARYRISDVPAGRYVVKAWKPGLGEVEHEVQVPERGEVALNFDLDGATK